jgi:hypothetical protein
MMGVERIHVCPNHCILYHGVFKYLTKYPSCGASQYKRNDNCSEEDRGTKTGNKRKKGGKKNITSQNLDEETTTLAVDGTDQRIILALVMWYLSPINHLRRLFSNPSGPKLLRWWALDEHKKDNGVLCHPSDAK